MTAPVPAIMSAFQPWKMGDHEREMDNGEATKIL